MPKAISYSIAGGISGGVASELTGGSFESGFTQGVYTALFNHAAHAGVIASGITWTEIGAGIRGFFTPIAEWMGGAAIGTAVKVGAVLLAPVVLLSGDSETTPVGTPSTPVGRRGSPLEVTPGAHASSWISDLKSNGKVIPLTDADLKNFAKNWLFSLASAFDGEAIAMLSHAVVSS